MNKAEQFTLNKCGMKGVLSLFLVLLMAAVFLPGCASHKSAYLSPYGGNETIDKDWEEIWSILEETRRIEAEARRIEEDGAKRALQQTKESEEKKLETSRSKAKSDLDHHKDQTNPMAEYKPEVVKVEKEREHFWQFWRKAKPEPFDFKQVESKKKREKEVEKKAQSKQDLQVAKVEIEKEQTKNKPVESVQPVDVVKAPEAKQEKEQAIEKDERPRKDVEVAKAELENKQEKEKTVERRLQPEQEPEDAKAERENQHFWQFWRNVREKPRESGAVGKGSNSLNAGVQNENNAATARREKDGKNGKEISALIKPGLVLNVQVIVSGVKEIDETAKRISEDARLTLPLVGSVTAKDLTITEFARYLNELYKEFFIDPQVIVEFAKGEAAEDLSPWGYVTVLGRVKQPGRVGIPPTRDLTLSSAIQKAGGLDTSAKETAIRITRQSLDGGVQTREVNLKAVGAQGQFGEDIRLQPDDVVYVPELIF